MTTFGGNQFKLPEDSLQFKTFFSIQLIFFKSGSFLGRFFNPIAKEKVKCFGADDCYPLAFGLPALAMLLGSITMLCGRKAFFHVAHGENMLLKVCKCIMVVTQITTFPSFCLRHFLFYRMQLAIRSREISLLKRNIGLKVQQKSMAMSL